MALLKIVASALGLALVMFFTAIYGVNFGGDTRQQLIVNQCTVGGQFVIKRTVYKCEKVKNATHQERQAVPQTVVD